MKTILRLCALIFTFVYTSCTNDNEPKNENGVDLTDYYKDYNLDFVSRLHFYKDDTLNYSEVKIENLAERSGKLNIVAKTFRHTESIFVGQVTGKELDLAVQSNSTVANTNYMINLDYASNPYNSKVEWDFDRQSRLHIINYLNNNSFFPNYFGGQFAGYYNANQGYNFFSTKKYPTVNAGYCRNVNNRMLFVDMYRLNAFYENKADSTWVEFPLTVKKNALSFDFETVDADYGVVAMLTSDSLFAFALHGTTQKFTTKVKTDNNQAFAGWDGAYSVAVYKNGNNTNQPYIVIRRNSTADIYKYDIVNSTLSEVYPDLPLPQIMHFSNHNTFGDCGRYHYFVFHGEKVMLFTGASTFTLKDKEFTEFKTNLPLQSASVVTALEAGSSGIYIGIQTLVSGKRVADIVLLK